MKNGTYWKKAKVKSPTVIPNFLLKLQGQRDGKKGAGVAESRIQVLLKKESELEARECVVCEHLLAESRKKAARLLNLLKSIQEPTALSEKSLNTDVVRAKRKCQTALNGLVDSHQELITMQTIMEERIKRIRDKSFAACQAYISGVKVSIPDFIFKSSTDNMALEIYYEKHKVLDMAIAAFLETKEAESNETV